LFLDCANICVVFFDFFIFHGARVDARSRGGNKKGNARWILCHSLISKLSQRKSAYKLRVEINKYILIVLSFAYF
ncbi:MAG: hypothetical protein K2J46_11175, partial [Muribaculaceae bacterium]|nr:hypothetical protein [Muribaculaceae bacterium]